MSAPLRSLLAPMHRPALIATAVALALLGLGLLGYQHLSGPTVLRLAVGPMGTEDTRLMAAAAQYLNRERATVRFRLVLTEGVAGSAEAIEEDKADLAVVRTDVRMPLKTLTVAILHRDAAVLIAPERSGIAKIADLPGRKVGIVRKLPANAGLLETVLEQYDLKRDGVPPVSPVVLSSPTEVEDALRAGEIDAVLVIGTLSGPSVSRRSRAWRAPPPRGRRCSSPSTRRKRSPSAGRATRRSRSSAARSAARRRGRPPT